MYLKTNDRIIKANLEYIPIYKACLLQQHKAKSISIYMKMLRVLFPSQNDR